MANEITSVVKLTAVKGNLTVSRDVTLRHDLAGDAYSADVIAVPTNTHVAISLSPAIGTAGESFFRNLSTSTANSVQLGTDDSGTFVPFMELMANRPAMCGLATNAVYAKSVTGTCLLEYVVLER
jgi:hypothetical protein